MALNFPDNPGIGSVFVDTNSGFSYKWDGTVWNGFAGSSASEISNLDDISGSFDGIETTFALTKDSVSVSPVKAEQLRVVLGGVTQTALTDYTINGSNIIFTTAPIGSLTCTITQLGVALSIAVPGDGTVTPAKLSTGGPSWNTSGDLYISGIATANNGLVVGAGLTLADDVKINLGNDNDLQIVHDGSNSLIDGAGTGEIHLKSDTEIKFLKRTGSENILVGAADGSVAAFYDNTKRLETTDGGALVYGTVGAGQTALVVEGDIKATGVVTAVSFNGDLVGTAATTNSTGLHVVGVATISNINSTNVTAGVVTATSFDVSTGTFSGDVDVADKIVHTGDTDTAIRFPAADTFTIETSGSEALRVDSSGNLGIGSESPAAKIDVNGQARFGGNKVVLGTDGSFGGTISNSTTRAFVFSNTDVNADYFGGRVIQIGPDGTINIGGSPGTNPSSYTSPNITLNANGGATFSGDVTIADKIVHAGDTNTAIRFPATDTITFETSGSEALRVDSSQRLLVGTASAPLNDVGARIQESAASGCSFVMHRNDTTVVNDDSLGLIRFYSNAGSSNQEHARISGLCDGAAGADDKPGKLVFYTTADAASSPTERVRLDSSGNMGLGSNSPSTRLHVKPASDVTTDGIRVQRQADDGQFLLLNYFGGTGQVAAVDTAGSSPILRFTRSTDNSTYTESARIDSSGNVLIGTATAGGKLHVESAATTAGWQIRTDSAGLANESGFYRDASDNYELVLRNGSGGLSFLKNDGGASTANLSFTVQGSERMSIASDGVVTVKNGAVAEIDTLTSATSVTPDFAASCNFTLTLGHNVTLNNPSNLTAGQSGSIFLIQDGTGSRTLSFGTYWDFAGGVPPTISTVGGSVDRLDYIVRSSTSIHAVVTLAYS